MSETPTHSVIVPPNTLKLKAERPGGITRSQAVEVAGAAVAAAEQEYRSLSQRDVDELEARAVAVLGPQGDAVDRRRLFRKAHDLWSLGDTFGFPLVTEVAGSLCSYLDAVPAGDSPDRAIVLLHVQSLRVLILGEVKGRGGPGEKAMVDGLRQAVAKRLG